jgi:bacteriocin biosynthesis cyclodehydratase domain-containing protein
MAPDAPDHQLPDRPRLHRSYYLMSIPQTSDFLLYREGRGVRLKPSGDARLLPRLLELLDGTRDVDTIIETLPDFDHSNILSSLKGLSRLGLLEEASVPPGDDPLSVARDAQRTLFSHLSDDPSSALSSLAEATVVIIGDGAVASALSEMLVTSGVGGVRALPAHGERAAAPDAPPARARVGRRSAEGALVQGPFPTEGSGSLTDLLAGATVAVAALDHPDPDLLGRVNTATLEDAMPLLPVVLTGWEGHLGPTCVAGRTACLGCADLRAKANLSHYEQYLLYEQAMRSRPGAQPFGRLPHFPTVLAGLAATEVIKLVTQCYPPSTYGRVVVVDLLTAETEAHDVLRVPRCPACGRNDRRARPSAPRQAGPSGVRSE